MTPYEIMLSESQERMLLVAKAGREREVEAVFEKWDLHAVRIGHVTDTGRVRLHHHGVLVADVPTTAPHRRGPGLPPADGPSGVADRRCSSLSFAALPAPPAPQAAFEALLASPVVASKRWAYEQFDHTRRHQHHRAARTHRRRRAHQGRARRAWRCRWTATAATATSTRIRGAMLAVAESARNVACAGAEPIGATNNLNFGNPERPEIMWQFGEAVRGIGEACRALDVPITGGNVSLYNETEGRAIYPTPVLGVVGLLDDASQDRDARVPIGRRRGDRAGRQSG